MDSLEFAEWVAYSLVEPFGQDRADLGAAIVASVIANVHRGEQQPPFAPADFLPNFDPPQEQTYEDQIALVEILNAAFGGTDERQWQP